MCFRIDALLCFGAVDHDDYCASSTREKTSATTTTTTMPQHHHLHHHPPPAQQNDHGYGYRGAAHHGNRHRAPPHRQHQHQHQQQLAVAAAANEEDRKASNDARRSHEPTAGAAATKGANGYGYAPAGGPQEKAHVYFGADGTLTNHPATNAKVAGGGPQHYYRYEHEPAAHNQHYELNYHYR